MKTEHVIVEDYNPEWKNEFERTENLKRCGSGDVQAFFRYEILKIDISVSEIDYK